jgi:type I restriction enzyme S subunit
MQTVPLCELGEVVSGSTPKTGVTEFWDGDIPWITPADLSVHNGIYFHGTPKKISTAGFESCSTAMLPPGSILFSSRAPIGHCALTAYPVCTNQGFKNVVPNKRLDPVYGYFALKFLTPAIVAMGRGATFAEINKELFASVQVPYCDLPEQRRIAARLEQADRLRRTRRYALELSDTFLPAAFLEFFGDPKLNPRHWPLEFLSTICSKFSDGPFGSNLKSEHYTLTGIRVIRLQNIGVWDFVDDNRAFISEKHFSALRKHECLPGDVLIGTMGDPNLRACILPANIPRALNKADCVQARPDERKVHAQYLRGLLNIPSTLSLIPGMVHGQTRARVSMGALAELPIPVPPLSLQQDFADLVEQFERYRSVQSEALRQAEHLFQSLLHRAFAADDGIDRGKPAAIGL